MKNREYIKNSLNFYIEKEIIDNLNEKGMSKENIAEAIKGFKETTRIEEKAELTLQEYEKYLLDDLGITLTNCLKDNIDDIRIQEKFNGLEGVVTKGNTDLKSIISQLQQIQNAELKNRLEEEIQWLKIEKKLLENHKKALDELSSIQAKKVSTWFAIVCVFSLLIWCTLIYYFTWDKMEKWTYISALCLIAINAIYFAIFEKNLNSHSLRKAKLEKHKNQIYSTYKYNDEFYDYTCKKLELKIEQKNILEEKLRATSKIQTL